MDLVMEIVVLADGDSSHMIYLSIPISENDLPDAASIFAERCSLVYRNGIVDSLSNTWYPPSSIRKIRYECKEVF
jgi:hypothetical protein